MDYNELMSPMLRSLKETMNNNIIELLFEHKCYYLLSNILLTDIQKRKLDMILAINEINYKIKQMSMEVVLKEIENSNYAIIKGWALSQKIYGDIRMRNFLDVDILVQRLSIETVKNVLLDNGFIQGYAKGNVLIPYKRKEKIFYALNTHQLAPFIKQTNNRICPFVSIDINFSVLWGEEKRNITDVFFKDLREDCIDGKYFKRLSPEMEFIHLCLHHYKDLNSIYLISKGKIGLNMFSDIFFYIINTKFDWNKLKDFSTELNVAKYIYYCLFFCSLIFYHDKLNEMLELFEFSRNCTLLQSYGLTENEKNKWKTNFYNRLLNKQFRYKFISELDSENIKKIIENEKFLVNGDSY